MSSKKFNSNHAQQLLNKLNSLSPHANKENKPSASLSKSSNLMETSSPKTPISRREKTKKQKNHSTPKPSLPLSSVSSKSNQDADTLRSNSPIPRSEKSKKQSNQSTPKQSLPLSSVSSKSNDSYTTVQQSLPKRQRLMEPIEEDEFLVKWAIDSRFSIVKRKHILHEGEVELGQSYTVRFGQQKLQGVVKFIGSWSSCCEMQESMEAVSTVSSKDKTSKKKLPIEPNNHELEKMESNLKLLTAKYEEVSNLLEKEYETNNKLQEQIDTLIKEQANTFSKLL
jgi:hypothetical protein